MDSFVASLVAMAEGEVRLLRQRDWRDRKTGETGRPERQGECRAAGVFEGGAVALQDTKFQVAVTAAFSAGMRVGTGGAASSGSRGEDWSGTGLRRVDP